MMEATFPVSTHPTERRDATEADGGERSESGGRRGAKQTEPDAPASLLGLKLSAAFEILIFFLGVMALDLLFLDGSRFQDVSPHPFWAIVILMAAHYGTREGVLAAVVASLILLTEPRPEPSLSEDLYDYSISVARLPLLWLVSATVLGEIRMRQFRDRRGLKQRLHTAEERGESIAAAYEKINAAKQGLEVQVASQFDSVATLFNAAKTMSRLQPDEVLLGVTEIVRSLINPHKFSIFLIEGSRFSVFQNHGWTPSDRFSESFGSDCPIFREIVLERRILCAARTEHQKCLGGEGVLAGPLVDAPSDRVFGMLKIEELSFRDFNLSTTHIFQAICEWLGTSYTNARNYQEARAAALRKARAQLFSSGTRTSQGTFLQALARKMGFDLSVVRVALTGPDSSQDNRDRFSRLLMKVVHEELRKTDVAFESRQSGSVVLLLLPGTSSQAAITVAGRIAESIKRNADQVSVEGRVSFAIKSLHQQTKAGGLLSREEFLHRLNLIERLSARVEIENTLLALETRSVERGAEGELHAAQLVRRSLADLLRDDSTALGYEASHGRFTVLLPGCGTTQAAQTGDEWKNRLQRDLGERIGALDFSVSVQKLSEIGGCS